jgi:D-alanine-D-alanine ligase
MKMTILFGGVSYEHEISIVSAISLREKLEDWDVNFIFLDKDRNFFWIEPENMRAKYFSSGEYKQSQSLTIKNGGFYQKGFLKEKRVETATLLNLVHGGDGEDGKLASLLEFFEIDFIGPRREASVISCNKLFTKLYAGEIGVKTVAYELLRRGEYAIKTPFPVIIKPLRLGSSIGVSIVRNEAELEYALDVAYEFDSEVLVEPFIEGVREYNLAGCKTDTYIYSIVEEPQKTEFLDFEKKYMDFSRTEAVSRASIGEALTQELQENFAKIYGNLFEGALIRCDFFVIDDAVYLNEINPIPGSMSNYLFEEFGTVMTTLANHLPAVKEIPITYQYIHSINSAKGK